MSKLYYCSKCQAHHYTTDICTPTATPKISAGIALVALLGLTACGDEDKDKYVGGKRMNSKSKKSRKIHMNVLHKKTKHKKMKVKKMSKMGKRKTKHHRKGGFNAAYTCTTSGKTSGNTKKKLKK